MNLDLDKLLVFVQSLHSLIPSAFDELPKDSLMRSEEHTSELQSQSNLVCRLLLEKKKKNIIFNKYIHSFISFFFTDTATTEIYTLSLHDALPILLILELPKRKININI